MLGVRAGNARTSRAARWMRSGNARTSRASTPNGF